METYSRITYDATTRTFERLFKEDSLEGMKEVVRKKLGVSTSIPVHLSQVRNEKFIDLEDDEDFEAFRSFAQDVPTVQVRVVLGSNADPETTSSPKQKRKEPDASSTLPPGSTVESSTPQKKRRVAFVERSSKQPSQDPQSAVTEASTSKNLQKRSRSQDQLAAEASSTPAANRVPAEMEGDLEDDLPSRPAKKSKQNHMDIVEESPPPKKSQATSVAPQSTVKHQATLPVKERKSQTKTKKTTAKEDPVVGAGPSGKPSKTATATSEVAPSIGDGQQKDASSSSLPTETTQEVVEVSEKRSRGQALPAEILSVVEEAARNSNTNSPDSVNMEDLMAAVQAVLMKKGIATPGPEATIQNPVESPTVANKGRPTKSRKKALPPPTVQEKEVEQEAEQTPDACPICDESPYHDPLACPVIKGGVRAMRKRVGQLEKITSEEREDERKQVLADLQERILKRSRKPRPKTSKGVPPIDDLTSTTSQAQDTSASLSKATKNAKQVDVVSSRAPVVNTVSTATSSQPAAEKPQSNRPPSSLLPPTSLKPLSSSQKQAKSSAEPKKPPTEKLMDSLPNAGNTDLQNLGDLSRLSDFSHVTDKDLKKLISGPKRSIDDVPSSSEEEEEEPDREEPILDEEEEMKEKTSRRLGQNVNHLEYPSSSDVAEEESAASSKLDTPERERGGWPLSEEPLSGLGERDTSPEGSSPDFDKADNNDAQAQDTAALSPAPASSLKQKAHEADSDTVVASQSEELVVKAKPMKTAKVNGVLPATDKFHEPSDDAHHSDEASEAIVSDDGNPPVQSTPKAELLIRTRNRSNRESGQNAQEDVEISESKTAKRTKKMPVLPNLSARVIKTAPAPNNRTRGQKTSKEVKGGAEEEEDSESLAQTTKNTKATPKAAERGCKTSVKSGSKATKVTSKATKALVDAVNKASGTDKLCATPKPKAKTSARITPVDPEKLPNDRKAFEHASSQWVSLQESPSQIPETPGQVDELLSESGTNVDRSQRTKAMINESPPRRLFLPDTQQTSPGGVSFGSQQTIGSQEEPSPHDSDDENEVVASVTKSHKTLRKYRGLSQISQTFSTPKFQSKLAKVKEPVQDRSQSLEEEEESESDSVSESAHVASHIPASRRAGLATSKKR